MVSTSIDDALRRFRIADRELYNQHFHIPNPYNDTDTAFAAMERFEEVQACLFNALVSGPLDLEPVRYRQTQPAIRVELLHSETPVMLNRELDSGYWDHPVTELSPQIPIAFISYFDWDQLNYHDNYYVRGEILENEMAPELVGKHVLIECLNVQFTTIQQ
jgi:hypothetical protein